MLAKGLIVVENCLQGEILVFCISPTGGGVLSFATIGIEGMQILQC